MAAAMAELEPSRGRAAGGDCDVSAPAWSEVAVNGSLWEFCSSPLLSSVVVICGSSTGKSCPEGGF